MGYKLSLARFLSYFGLAVFTFFFLIACEEKPLEVGVLLSPDDESLGVGVDTLSLESFTISNQPIEESTWLVTDAPNKRFSLGYLMDPVFGESKAEVSLKYIYADGTEFSYSEKRDSFSLKLRFEIDPSILHGDTSDLTFSIYELSEVTIPSERSDYIMNSGNFSLVEVNSDSGQIHIYQEISDKADTSLAVYLDFQLKDELISRLTDRDKIEVDSIYMNNGAFINEFKGFYIRANRISGTGAVLSVVPKTSSMTLSYVDSIGTVVKDSIYRGQVTYSFKFVHNMFHYAHSPSQIQGLNDTVNQSNKIYLQSLAGTRGYLKIDTTSLGIFKKDKDVLAINKAELIIPISSEGNDTIYNWPDYLAVRSEEDELITGDAYLSGYLDVDNMEYRLNITPYMNDFIKGQINNRIYLFAAERVKATSGAYYYQSSINAPERIILNSGINKHPMIIRVIYSEISN